jgi:hypothetical protein
MSGLFDQITNYSPPLLTAGQVNYKGTWDASANTPTLVSPPAATSKGDYYVVSAAGTQFSISFAVGDWIISNGTAWEKVDLTDAVSSVFGRTGAVVGVSTDYSAVGLTNTAIGASSPSTGVFTNAYADTLSAGFTSVAAAGTVTTLVVGSVRDWTVTGSGGQTYQLPDATTLRNGAMFQFNNNQSSGTVVVRNNSATTVTTLQSGSYVEIILLSNATAAGSWDVHNQAPSNVSWSTNTLDYPGSITSATWNGNVVAINRGGTNSSSGAQATARLTGYTTTAAIAGTTTLTNTSTCFQTFTGSSSQTVVLPVTSTLEVGWKFVINNRSTGTLTVNSSGANIVISIASNITATIVCIGTTLTTAADWNYEFSGFLTRSGTGNVLLGTGPSISSPIISGSTTLSGTPIFTTSSTTDAIAIGNTAGTGTITLGRSTASQTLALGGGVTASGSTNTINIGTAGAAGSTTAITLGSTANTSSVAVNGALSATSNITSTATNPYFVGSSSTAGNIYYGSTGAASPVQTLVNNTPITTVSSAGFAVTGGLSTTGSVTATSGFIIGNDNSFLYDSGTAAVTLRLGASGPYGSFLINSGEFMVDGPSGTLALGAGGSRVATLTSTGLAVTGALSSTTGANFATSSGNVGIGTASPATKLDVTGTTVAFGVAATGVNITIREYSASTARNWSIRDDSSINRLRFSRGSSDQVFWDVLKVAASDQTSDQFWYTDGAQRMQLSSVGLAVTGALSCTGALSKGSGSFRIEHPLPEKSATHQLVHSFIEGPQADLIYRGKVVLVDGKASVNIDTAATMTEGTFEVLCREVQCFTTNESGWTAVRGKVTGNILTIEAKDADCSDEISWMVIGERQDPHMMETDWTDDNGKVIVEPLKPSIESN